MDPQVEFIRFVAGALRTEKLEKNPHLGEQLKVIRAGKAALEWVKNSGDCLFCHYRANDNKHEEYCGLRD